MLLFLRFLFRFFFCIFSIDLSHRFDSVYLFLSVFLLMILSRTMTISRSFFKTIEHICIYAMFGNRIVYIHTSVSSLFTTLSRSYTFIYFVVLLIILFLHFCQLRHFTGIFFLYSEESLFFFPFSLSFLSVNSRTSCFAIRSTSLGNCFRAKTSKTNCVPNALDLQILNRKYLIFTSLQSWGDSIIIF